MMNGRGVAPTTELHVVEVLDMPSESFEQCVARVAEALAVTPLEAERYVRAMPGVVSQPVSVARAERAAMQLTTCGFRAIHRALLAGEWLPKVPVGPDVAPLDIEAAPLEIDAAPLEVEAAPDPAERADTPLPQLALRLGARPLGSTAAEARPTTPVHDALKLDPKGLRPAARPAAPRRAAAIPTAAERLERQAARVGGRAERTPSGPRGELHDRLSTRAALPVMAMWLISVVLLWLTLGRREPDLVLIFTGVSGIALLLGAFVGSLSLRPVAREVKRLQLEARRLADGDLREPIMSNRDDELGGLAGTLERIRLALQGRQAVEPHERPPRQQT
jgi:HAMP domain-containing protein